VNRGHTFLLGMLLLLVSYIALGAWVPPSDDEIYYWCWAKQLQLSYFDHPPLTAYMIRASIEVFGDHVWAVRLPACLSSVVVLGVLAHLMRSRWLWPMLLLTPLYNFGGFLITPDTPLLLCWALYLLWLVKAHEQLDRPSTVEQTDGIPLSMWLLGGVILGFGGLGKYPMILAVPCGAIAFLFSGKPLRNWLPGYLIHGVLAFTMVVPVFVFNWQLDFAPLRFQWEHATCSEHERGLLPLLEFLGIQVVLMGWLPLLLYPWLLRNGRSLLADPRLRVCLCLFILPFTFFGYQAFKKPLEGNWALACYLGFWPLAAYWADVWARTPLRMWLVRSLFSIPAGASLFLLVHMIEPLPLIKPHNDRITRQNERWKAFQEASQVLQSQEEKLPVYTPLYQSTAMLQFHGVEARQLDGISRPSHFTMPPRLLTEVDRAYVFNEGPLMPEQAVGFGPPEIIANIPVVVRGEVYTVYQILLYTKCKPTNGR
jgi:4-amino-4-deoxy-L-arabinose transferase-like glycosyltransferase